MENTEMLQKLGLSELEARIYLFLLKEGSKSTGKIAKFLKIQRSTVYYLLDSLKQKGMVVDLLFGKRSLFQAANPKILEKQAQEVYFKIKEEIPLLVGSYQQNERDEARVYIGYKGLVSAYEELISECKNGEEILVLGARGGEDVSSKTYGNFYKNFNLRRVNSKVKQRVIMNLDLRSKIGKYYQNLSLTKVRYLNQKTFVPVVVFPKGIMLVQWKEEPSIFFLKGKEVAASFKQYFEALWIASRKI